MRGRQSGLASTVKVRIDDCFCVAFVVATNPEEVTHFREDSRFKVPSLIRMQLERHSKLANNLIHQGLSNSPSLLIGQWKGLCPLGEIVCDN